MITHIWDGQPSPSIPALNEWLDKRGVQRLDGIEIAPMADGSGLRMMAARDLVVGETICKVPKTVLLSTRSSNLPMFTQQVNGASTPSTSHTILGLAVALLHELRLGTESEFWGYIQSLPREPVPIPTLWPLYGPDSDARKAMPWLQGTEAERDLRRREREGVGISHLRAYYSEVAMHLPPTTAHPNRSSFYDFAYAFSLVSTRAFVVDLYHMVALCPFADILNHTAASHTSLASDDFVCHRCGQLAACEHDVVGPFNDVPPRLEHVSAAEIARIGTDHDTVDMYVEYPVKKGREIMNTYGDGIGEARLLVEWAFVPGSRPAAAKQEVGAVGGDGDCGEDGNDSESDLDDTEHAGDGITWDLDELVDDAVATQWVESGEGDVVALRLFPPDAEESSGAAGANGDSEPPAATTADDSTLICPPSDRDGVYHLNHAGQVSLRLFGVLHLAVCAKLGEGSADLCSDVNHLEAAWEHVQNDVRVPARALAPGLRAAARSVRDLISSRLESMYQPELGVGEVYDLREALGEDEGLQAMAMTIVINEVALLKGALERWDELLRCTEGEEGEK